jgi:hypothetical protein
MSNPKFELMKFETLALLGLTCAGLRTPAGLKARAGLYYTKISI